MGERQAKVNEKRQCFKGWETLVIIFVTTEKFLNGRALKYIFSKKIYSQNYNFSKKIYIFAQKIISAATEITNRVR